MNLSKAFLFLALFAAFLAGTAFTLHEWAAFAAFLVGTGVAGAQVVGYLERAR